MSAELQPPDGLTTVKSRYGPAETLTRLETSIAAHGLTVFTSIGIMPRAPKTSEWISRRPEW